MLWSRFLRRKALKDNRALKLVIVESPAKAKTISRFLGKEYTVAASYGHVRDLPSSAAEIPAAFKSKPWARMAVDTENGFVPIYVIPRDSKKNISELKKLLQTADEVILATDEDREGESISWHLLEILKPKAPVKRIAFHEITATAIEDALASPRNVNMDLVRAQESRRILDRLFGYSLSPVLWKKVGPKLSAGRVQSVAVRLVVEREEERKAFVISDYWSIEAKLSAAGKEFVASLTEIDGRRPAVGKDFDGTTGRLKDTKEIARGVIHLTEAEAKRISRELETCLPWWVLRVEQKEARQRPYPPYMTSSLQQGASAVLNMSPRQTMMIAQRLYEGVDLGGGEREGVITYMRTDSLTLSEKALAEAGHFIKSKFGESYYDGPRRYATKSKNAQEAHEAIRPTHFTRTPDQLRPFLESKELDLYRLIWNRAVASQMTDARLLKTTVDFQAQPQGKNAVLRANGSVVVFPGFLRIADSSQKDAELPEVREGQRVGKGEALQLDAMEPNSHQTQPPARYTEASLIQRLEEEGIGRPSTYAPIISTIQQRGYVERKGKALLPTFLAIGVVSILRDHFTEYVDIGFTARMEDALDEISNGRQDSLDFLTEFYHGKGKFGGGLVLQIENELPKMVYPAIAVGKDPKSGDPITVRLGRNGPYLLRGEGGPENTATLPQEITYEELTPEKAAELIEGKVKTNEALGLDPVSGQKVFGLIGPYGPYVQLGEAIGTKKPRRMGLPKGMTLADVNLETALRLLELPRTLGTHPESKKPISASLGRFGPFVKHESDFRSIGQGDDVLTITLERALELFAQPKRSRQRKFKSLANLGADPVSQQEIHLCEGKYGPFVTNGSVNVSIPKGAAPTSITLEQALAMLSEAAKAPRRAAKPRKRKPTGK